MREFSIKEKVAFFENTINKVKFGHINAAIIGGRGGIGKTYQVMKLLEGSNYVVIKGSITAVQFVNVLYNNNNPDKILVFDDTEVIGKDVKFLNLIKAALDTPRERQIDYLSSSKLVVKNSFKYVGRVIMITNQEMDMKNGHVKAILSRCQYINFDLSNADVIAIIKSNIANMGGEGLNLGEKHQCLQYLTTLCFKENTLDFRIFERLAGTYRFHRDHYTEISYKQEFDMYLNSLAHLG